MDGAAPSDPAKIVAASALAALAASADVAQTRQAPRPPRPRRQARHAPAASSRKAIGDGAEDCDASHVRPILGNCFRASTRLHVVA
jgi:hypothetical protein